MRCPPEDLLFLLAQGALPDEPLLPEEAALLEGWDRDELEAHLRDCDSCRRRSVAGEQMVSHWRRADPAADERFDERYFTTLANEVLATLPRREPATVSRIHGLTAIVAVAFAAAAAIFVMLVLSPPPEAAKRGLATASNDGLDEAELIAEAKALGKTLLRNLDEGDEADPQPPESPLLASALRYGDGWEDDLAPDGGSLLDDLDTLNNEQLELLLLRL